MKRILHPKKWVLSAISLVSYTTLILIFVSGKTESVLAYPIYCMSAYSLVAFGVAVPDVAFRGNISIYQGMTVNFLYMIFRAVTGIQRGVYFC